MHYNIFYYSRLEPTQGFEPQACCLQGSCSTAELSRHKKQANISFIKKYILQTFVLQNLQQTLLYYAHGRLSTGQLLQYFSNGGNCHYHAEDQYLETFIELQHYLISFPIKNDSSNTDIRLLAPTPFLQFGYPRSSQSSYFENTKTVSFSRCHLTVGRITALPLVEPNGMVYYIQLCSALISLSSSSRCSPTALPTMDFVLRLQYPTSLPIKE